jgi:hypothetical protein
MQTVYAFALGDQVDLARAPHNTMRGPYEITAILPESPTGDPQYSLRSESGAERNVTEAEILPASEPIEAPKPSPEEAKAQREEAKAERKAEANSAWKDYLDERDHVARRTAELRELRLKAEAEAAIKIAKLAREAALQKAKGPVKGKAPAGKAVTSKSSKSDGKPAPKGKADAKVEAKPAAKAELKPAPKAEAKPAAKAPVVKTKVDVKPVEKTKPAAKAVAKAPAKTPAKTKVPVKAAAKDARPKAASVARAKPAAKAKSKR